MKIRIRKCPKCGKYTLKDKCPKCGSETIGAKPAKFSPHDPYGRYRRRMKMQIKAVKTQNETDIAGST